MNHAFRKLAYAVLASMALVSCANVQNQRTQARVAQIEEHCRQLYTDSRIDPIRDKVPVQMMFRDSIPMQMMSNDNRPTEEERTAILAWADQRQLCQQYAYAMEGSPPAHMQALRSANSQAMADLYAGKITYGEFARQIDQNRINFLQQDQVLRAQAQRDALQAQQASQQQLYQLQQLNLQQQQINNQRLQPIQPIQSPSMNCTTQYVGNQAYTHCN